MVAAACSLGASILGLHHGDVLGHQAAAYPDSFCHHVRKHQSGVIILK